MLQALTQYQNNRDNHCKALSSVKNKEDEEVYEGVRAGNRRGLESQDPDALCCGRDGTEVMSHLHIEEEDEERKDDCPRYPIATLTGPRAPKEDSNAAKTRDEVFSCCLIPEELTSLTTIS